LCTFLFTAELIPANPMALVGRPKLAKTPPKALPAQSVAALLSALESDPGRPRRSDWIDRDRALILTSLLAGLRSDELLRANISDVRRTDDGAVIQVRGKGGKDRRIPVESALVDVLEHYLDSRAIRFPTTVKQRSPAGGLAAWAPRAPLFVGGDGERITRGTLQYRVLRAFRRAGIDADRARGALVHGLRHTFATELANSDVSVYTLMRLLGHESMVTSQRYVSAAGTESRTAAAQNKLYELLPQGRRR
jgi:integrase